MHSRVRIAFGSRLTAMAASKRRRRDADDRALEILKEGRIVTDADVLECLTQWRFKKNTSRQNVIPVGGIKYVFSDTLGLVVNRVTKRSSLDATSRKNPSMLRLLSVWLRDRQPTMFECSFPFTSININYATGEGHKLSHTSVQLKTMTRNEH